MLLSSSLFVARQQCARNPTVCLYPSSGCSSPPNATAATTTSQPHWNRSTTEWRRYGLCCIVILLRQNVMWERCSWRATVSRQRGRYAGLFVSRSEIMKLIQIEHLSRNYFRNLISPRLQEESVLVWYPLLWVVFLANSNSISIVYLDLINNQVQIDFSKGSSNWNT